MGEQTPEASLAKTWLDSLAALDADCLAGQFAAGAQLRLESDPPVMGQAAVRKTLARFLSRVLTLRYELVSTWICGGVAVLETDLTIVREDHTVVALPATVVLWFKNQAIERCRISTVSGQATGLAA